MEQELKEKVVYTDEVGGETLDVISEADNFNKWMFKTVDKNTSGEILEIGSGIGNISGFFVDNNRHISVSDMRDEYCTVLREKFTGKNNFKSVYQIDIIDPDFDKKHSGLFGKFNSVFALNIIEHVEKDDLAIKNCLKLLSSGGQLLILVPAFNWLFNSFDVELGHYRRYNKKQLEKIFIDNKIDINYSRYFNFAGILGWWFSGKILNKKNIPSGQMKLYNRLVWIFKVLDFFTNRFLGLSVIVSGRKA
jgi:2-polyprenyl-3-methyl-5-hydroxy-6-metoxy-1,4-benzoquinol methylase